jgi:YNFM family putative membrane transporter
MAISTRPRAGVAQMAGFLLGASAMFAAMYSTQAILPVLGDEFGIAPSRAGLTISVLVGAVAVGGWIWGPFSDRFGRRRSLTLASGLLVAPTVGVAVAPTFGLLLVFRALQGLCMPGLLAVGVPYVAEVFGPLLGGRAMGYYVGALVFGGILGRVGVGLLTAALSWRAALGLVALLPAAAVLVMWRLLPEAPTPPRAQPRRAALAAHLRNQPLMVPTVCAATLFFSFVGVFSYVTFRLQAPPFGFGTEVASLVFILWVFGAAGPVAGRLADRVGWRRVVVGALALALAGVAVSLPDTMPTVVLGLAMVILGMFSGVTAAQLGVAAVTEADRGTASALYFTAYYVGGALAGFLPGLAWQAWAWPGVAGLAAAALGTGLLTALAGPRHPTPR